MAGADGSIEGLEGSPFADLVGRLLEAELASAGLAGTALTQTYRTNAPDGGVDAGLDSDLATVWVPLGQSAWQFKAGDLAPAACKTELLGATAALEVLKNGGSWINLSQLFSNITAPESTFLNCSRF